jgi:uncharacterized membrane protein
MAKTIGNPVSWTAQQLAHAGGHAAESAERLGGSEDAATLTLRSLSMQDLRDALRLGWADFQAARSDVMFLCLFYPVMGLVIAGFSLRADLVPLLFPLVSGFALLGPLAAVGLYEISRRREAGEPFNWGSALAVFTSPAFPSMVVLGLYLTAIFAVWLAVAHAIYMATLGPEMPEAMLPFLSETLTTPAGWAMIVIGCATGFVFALAVLATSVVSFPLLLDRRVGVAGAIATSWRVFRRNPSQILAWGLIVAVGLVLGFLPFLIGLVIVLPVLGHATWHLYRRAIG